MRRKNDDESSLFYMRWNFYYHEYYAPDNG